jgi:hypothetical protein
MYSEKEIRLDPSFHLVNPLPTRFSTIGQMVGLMWYKPQKNYLCGRSKREVERY